MNFWRKNTLTPVLCFWLAMNFICPLPLLRADDPPPASTAALQYDADSAPSETKEQARKLLLQITGESTEETHNPLDIWGFFDSMASITGRHHPVDSLEFKLGDQPGIYHRYGGALSYQPTAENLSLLSYNQILLKLRVPVHSMASFGRYLVFLEKDAFDPTQQINQITLSFIDLKKFSSLLGTEHTPPIFRFNVKVDTLQKGFHIKEDRLYFEELELTEDTLEKYSDLHELAMDVTANLISAKTYEGAQPFMKDFEKYFRAASQESGLLLEGANKTLETQEQVRSGSSDFFQEKEFQATLQETVRVHGIQRKAMARLSHLWQRLSVPHPMESAKTLREGLAYLAQGLGATGAEREFLLKEGSSFQVFHKPYVKWGLTVAGAAMVSMLAPVETAQFVQNAFEVSSASIQYALGKFQILGSLSQDSFRMTLGGWHPGVLSKICLSEETRGRFFVGITAMVTLGLSTLAIPSFLINSWQLIHDLKFKYTGMNPFHAFIQRSQDIRRRDLDLHAKLAAQKYKLTAQVFSSTDDEEADFLVQKAEKESKVWPFSFLNGIKDRPPPNQDIQTFAQALKYFLFSFGSLDIMEQTLTRWRNHVAIYQGVFVSPRLWALATLYPRFISKALAAKKDVENETLNLPSRHNGGTDSWPAMMKKIASRALFLKNADEVFQQEDAILAEEEKIMGIALNEGFKALMEMSIADGKEVKKALKLASAKDLSEPLIQSLSFKHRVFFTHYVQSLMDESISRMIASKNLSANDGKTIIEQVIQEGTLKRRSQEQVSSLSVGNMAKNLLVDFKQKSLTRIRPDHFSLMGRVHQVNQMLKDPESVSRGVRSLLSTLFINKSMTLVFSIMSTAMVMDGVNKLLYDEMFSDQSFFYFSNTVFLNHFLSGIALSVFGNIWMKMQRDAPNVKHLGHVPEGEDGDIGYLKWLYKKTFRNEHNTWKDNQKNQLSILWSTLKPSIAMYFIVDMLTLHRFDLEGFLTSLIVSIPFLGVRSMLEQGFEQASFHYLKHFPKKFWSHPKVQHSWARWDQARRHQMTFLAKFFLGEPLDHILLNLQRIADPAIGKEAFSRTLAFGKSFTGWTVAGLRKLGLTMSWLPGAQAVTSTCEELLTNGYDDWKDKE